MGDVVDLEDFLEGNDEELEERENVREKVGKKVEKGGAETPNTFAEIHKIMSQIESSGEMIVPEVRGVGTVAQPENINALFDRASTLINKQMGFEESEEGEQEESQEQDLKSLTLDRVKTENFMQGVDDMIELSHKAELLATDTLKFKRKDELQLMQSLLNIFMRVSSFTEARVNMAVQTLELMMSKPEMFSYEMIKLTESQINEGLDKACVIADKIEKLIKTERHSGNRGWGPNMTRGNRVMAFLDSIAPPVVEPGKEGQKRLTDGSRALTDAEFDALYEAQRKERG